MSLHIASLNSGSNGNCYYIGNEHEAVLIDAGISCRETEKRMLRLGLNMQRVKAIFVSHEHIDHISGIPMLVKKYKIPVYITQPTLKNGGLLLEETLVKGFEAFRQLSIGELQITAFPKIHDAIHPHSFTVSHGDIHVGVITDIGIACQNVISHFSRCHAVFLEANYDEDMLEKGNYPYHLKRRISGGSGHISNRQALELFIKHRPQHLSHLLLSHLSKNNNDPKLVQDLFDNHAAGVQIIIASRYQETAVYQIGATIVAAKDKKIVVEPVYYQTSLF
jgi:phosphoribosyl 1,2-cyclic phosphodiesterase